MNEQVRIHIEKYPAEAVELFNALRKLMYDSVSLRLEETLWAKLPSYYFGDNFVRLIPFKDHINIEANAITKHKEGLTGYKITPKGMLQIYVGQSIPNDILAQIFVETLANRF